jgi:hypothetical protein
MNSFSVWKYLNQNMNENTLIVETMNDASHENGIHEKLSFTL